MSLRNLGREISLFGRRKDALKDRSRVLQRFAEWRTLLAALPAPRRRNDTLLVVRLDDIGDYLLFRNQLAMYKRSSRWAGHTVTLLGNASWRELFLLLDRDSVDEVVWVEKNRYLEDAAYRTDIWSELRRRGFETVIAPACTRPLLLDDLCLLAAAPLRAIGCVGSHQHASWNEVSDPLYAELFTPSRPLLHEFHFNGEFAAWACGMRYPGDRPHIERPAPTRESALESESARESARGPYRICFVGASTRSKRWPVRRWLEFIALHRRAYSSRLMLAGNTPSELDMVRLLQQRTAVDSIAGRVGLAELLDWIAGAEAVVTNDTMAAHLGVALDVPTVIVANGVNYMRFANYAGAGIDGVTTVYPEVVNRRRRREGDGPYHYSETVSADIASIRATAVMGALEEVLPAAS